MTVEEKLNQAAGTIEEGVKKYPSCKISWFSYILYV